MEARSANLGDDVHFASPWSRLLAVSVDTILAVVTLVPFIPIDWWALKHGSVVTYAAHRALWLSVLAWFVVYRGGTPGELVLRLQVVDKNGSFLGWFSAWRRLLVRLVGVSLSTTALYFAGEKLQEIGMDGAPGFLSVAMAAHLFGGPSALWDSWWSRLCLVDTAFVFVNKRHRAIHDFLAGSFVVARRSRIPIETAT